MELIVSMCFVQYINKIIKHNIKTRVVCLLNTMPSTFYLSLQKSKAGMEHNSHTVWWTDTETTNMKHNTPPLSWGGYKKTHNSCTTSRTENRKKNMKPVFHLYFCSWPYAKSDKQIDGWTNRWTNKRPKSNMPLQCLWSLGHNNS